MANEIVTKSSRFFCVSMAPDLCKTPVGASTPPIPYVINGEFSQATGVSRNIKSNDAFVAYLTPIVLLPNHSSNEFAKISLFLLNSHHTFFLRQPNLERTLDQIWSLRR